jgi:hypothetical protein
MQCRQVLLEIRRKRDEELKEYQELCTKIGPTPYHTEIIKKRQEILILELPFKTDTPSIGAAALQKELKEKIRDQQGSIIQRINEWRNKGSRNQQYARKHIYKIYMEISAKYYSISYDEEGNKKIGPLSKLPPDELEYVVTLEMVQDAINLKTLNPRSRAVYKSLFKDLRRILNSQEGDLYRGAITTGISSEILAGYLEHLEQRCLKAKKSDKSYRNLLEVRTLLYLPLPCTQLNKITLSDIGSSTRKTEPNKINGCPFPSSFIELAKAVLSDNEPFLKRNSKQLGRFIEQSSNAAKLEGKIKLKQIQRSMKAICQKEQFLAEYLPSR